MDDVLYVYRKAAIECLTNADRLYKDAKMMLEYGRFPSATALSIIGLEEVGKGVIFALISMDVLSTEIVKFVTSHDFKEYYSMIAVSCADQITELLSEMQTEYEVPITDDEWVVEFFKSLLSDESLYCILSPRKAREEIDYIYSDEFTSNDESSKNSIKKASLYVDIASDSSVKTPFLITQNKCEECVTELEWSLSVLSQLKRMLHSEKKWSEISKVINRC